jgi:hypothetical protein
LRLFAVACCRRVWSGLSEQTRQDIGVVERYCRGEVSDEDVLSVADGNFDIAGYAASFDMVDGATTVARIVVDMVAATGGDRRTEEQALCHFLRQTVRNPLPNAQ